MPIPESALTDLPPLAYCKLREQVRTGDLAIPSRAACPMPSRASEAGQPRLDHPR